MAKAGNKSERVSFAFSRYETTLREKRKVVEAYTTFSECRSPEEAEIYFQLHPELLQVERGVYVSTQSTEDREERDTDDKLTNAVH
jgi:hypothetical protein